MSDRIERSIELKAPVSRVWQALTDHEQFGQWFRVKLEGPFVAGQPSTGRITYPGYEHVRWRATVKQIEPERLFSFTWHPYAIDPDKDYSDETPTLVEFTLQKTPTGTLLRVVESGFDKVPAYRREEALPITAAAVGAVEHGVVLGQQVRCTLDRHAPDDEVVCLADLLLREAEPPQERVGKVPQRPAGDLEGQEHGGEDDRRPQLARELPRQADDGEHRPEQEHHPLDRDHQLKTLLAGLGRSARRPARIIRMTKDQKIRVPYWSSR